MHKLFYKVQTGFVVGQLCCTTLDKPMGARRNVVIVRRNVIVRYCDKLDFKGPLH